MIWITFFTPGRILVKWRPYAQKKAIKVAIAAEMPETVKLLAKAVQKLLCESREV